MIKRNQERQRKSEEKCANKYKLKKELIKRKVGISGIGYNIPNKYKEVLFSLESNAHYSHQNQHSHLIHCLNAIELSNKNYTKIVSYVL